MHFLHPSTLLTLFSLLLVGLVAPSIQQDYPYGFPEEDRCFGNEGLVATHDIRYMAKDFHSPPHYNYTMKHWSLRFWDHNSVRICIHNEFWAHDTTITSEEVGNALDVIYKCCDPASVDCKGGYHQAMGVNRLPLDIETVLGGQDCQRHWTDSGSQIGT